MFKTQGLMVIFGEDAWMDRDNPPSMHGRYFVTVSAPTWRKIHTNLYTLRKITVTALWLTVKWRSNLSLCIKLHTMFPHMQYHALAPCYVHMTSSTTCEQSHYKQTGGREMINIVEVYVPRKTRMSSWMIGEGVGQAWSCKVNACCRVQGSWAGCSGKNTLNPCCRFEYASMFVPSRAALTKHFTSPKGDWECVEQSSISFEPSWGVAWLGKLQGSNYQGVRECDFRHPVHADLHQAMSRRLQQCIANGGDIVGWIACKDGP